MKDEVVTPVLRRKYLEEINRLQSIIDQLKKKDELKSRKLREKDAHIAYLEKVTRLDPMTGAYNKGSLPGILRQEINRAKRSGQPFCIAMLDLDFFKKINDTYGHLVGDQVINTFVELIEGSIRNTDRVIRYGGEEFVVVLSNCSLGKAKKFFERFRRILKRKFIIEVGAEMLRPTASFGVTEWTPETKSGKELIAKADAALYAAKQAGRDQIQVA